MVGGGIPNGWEAREMGEIMQKCVIFCNQERARGRRPRKKVKEPGM